MPPEKSNPETAATVASLCEADLLGLLGLTADWIWQTDASGHPTMILPLSGDKPARRLVGVFTGLLSSSTAFQDAFATREPFSDLRVPGPDGQGHLSLTGAPLLSDDGAFEGFQGTVRRVEADRPHQDAPASGLPEPEDHVRELKRQIAEKTQYVRRVEAAINAANAGFLLWDADDRLVFHNDAVRQIAGEDADLRNGQSFREFITSYAHSGWEPCIEGREEEWIDNEIAARKEGAASAKEVESPDGRIFQVRAQKTAAGDTMEVLTDVTAFRSAAREAARANQTLERVLNSVPAQIVMYDGDDRFLFANAEARKTRPELASWRTEGSTIGDVLREGLKTELFDYFVDEDLNRLRHKDPEGWIEAVLDRWKRTGCDTSIRRQKDGRWIKAINVRHEDGTFIGVRFDVTEQKEAELASEATRKQLEGIVETLPASLVVYDENNRLVMVNRTLNQSLPALKAFHSKAGGTLRESFALGREAGYFRDSGDAEVDALYDAGGEAWLAAMERLYDEPERIDERQALDGRWYKAFSRRLPSGLFVGVRVDITEQKEEEFRSETVRQQLEGIVETLPAELIVWDANNRILFANETYREWLPELDRSLSEPGAHLRDLLREGRRSGYFCQSGFPGIDTLYEKDPEAWLDACEKSYDVPHLVVERRTPSGAWHKVFNRRLPSGLFVGIRVDITDQKEAELKSEAMRRRLVNVIDSLHLDVLIYDENNQFLMANKRMREKIADGLHQPGQSMRDTLRVGRSRGFYSCVDDPAIDSLYRSDEEAWLSAMERYYEEPYRCYERRRLDGNWYKAIDVRTEDGMLIMLRVDLTKEKQVQEDLEKSLHEIELFREIVDNVPAAIYTKDQDGRLTYANKAWGRISQTDRHEAIGRNDVELFGECGRAFAENDRYVMAAFESGAATEGIEIAESRKMPDGSVRYQHSSKSRFELNGKPVLLGSTIDVTEARQREAELAEARKQAELADRAKSEFLANMSHEIRTPMNGVLGMAELLSHTELNGKQRTFTNVILKSGNALLTIINDILDFSKIDAGQLVLESEAFDLAEAVQDVATLMSVRAKEKDLELIVRYAPELPTNVLGDVGRMRQIITNLVGNAVKFTEEGHVLVDVSGIDQAGRLDLTIRVEDTGIGIPDEKLQSVFDKFSQVDASSTRRHEGTGLGLAITSRLVQMMGGTMDVASEFGVGSAFSINVSLPIAEAQVKACAVRSDFSGARVLAIDDNPVNRTILLEQMAAWKFDACAASSGTEGLAILEAARAAGLPVDCVVLDYQMPIQNGEDVARAIHGNPLLRGTGVVMLTSVDHAVNQSSCSEMRVDAYLVKPARSSVLLDTLLTVLHDRGTNAERAGTPQSFRSAEAPLEAAGRTMGDGEPFGSSEPERLASIASPVPVGKEGGQLDLLIAEDNEVNQMVVEQILEDLPYSYALVANGEMAVETFVERSPRLILMDVSMPRMNGLEATAHIRQFERKHDLERTPIVAVTAHALKGDRERCMESGMDDYLSKPINHGALREMLCRYLEEEKPLRKVG